MERGNIRDSQSDPTYNYEAKNAERNCTVTGLEAWKKLSEVTRDWEKIRFPGDRKGVVKVPYGFPHDLAKLGKEAMIAQGVPRQLVERIMNSDFTALDEFLLESNLRLEQAEIDESGIRVDPLES